MARRKFGWHSGTLTCNNVVVEDTLTFGSATATTLAASGAATVGSTLTVTGKATFNGSVDVGSAGVLAGVGTGSSGIKLKNLKNDAATALSGTQKDIEIDIGGTPYYFTVYPTKA
jgi:hypothetical protein